MRRLVGEIPRTSVDHRSRVGRRYTAVARAYRERYGKAAPAVLIQLAARLEAMEIPPLEIALDRANARGRQTEARRVRRQLSASRHLLLRTLERIEQAAATHQSQRTGDWAVDFTRAFGS